MYGCEWVKEADPLRNDNENYNDIIFYCTTTISGDFNAVMSRTNIVYVRLKMLECFFNKLIEYFHINCVFIQLINEL